MVSITCMVMSKRVCLSVMQKEPLTALNCVCRVVLG